MTYSRYAIYFTPRPGALATAGADWLGWDIARGKSATAFDATLAKRPQKYGFHATIKAPFHLAQGQSQQTLCRALEQFCAHQARCRLDGLKVAQLGSFLALCPIGATEHLNALAASVVQDFDKYRAPLTDAERTRKTRPNMTARQQEYLKRFGYPHVMDDFRFHMTLTGPVPKAQRDSVFERARARFDPLLTKPMLIDCLTLVGQGSTGHFYEIERFDLTGMAD
ncbi:MAG: DUF1045 domain-containing protein [Roseobacter sp.]